MRVLVTGSSGFIGTHLSQRLLRAGYDVVGLDRRPPPRPANYRFHQGDILDRKAVSQALAEAAPEAVVHLAARTDLGEKRDLSAYAVNVAGVENVLHAVQASPAVRRIIFASSQLVCPPGAIPKSDTDYSPHTLYGRSKALGEQAVRSGDGAGKIWCIVRPTTVWGPGMSAHYQRVLRLIKTGRYYHVGRKLCYKSWGYAGNVAFQLQKLLEAAAETIHRKVFYLADYQPLSLRAWADALQVELGARPIQTIPESAAWFAARGGDLLNRIGFRNFPFNSFRLTNVLTESVVDLTETRQVCGDLPCSMAEGIRETVAWFNHLQKRPEGSS